jgi:hypothetical protein
MKNPGDGLLEYALSRSDEELCQEALEAIRHWRDHAVVCWDLAEELGTLLRRLMVSVETVVEHPTEAELWERDLLDTFEGVMRHFQKPSVN